MNNTDIAAQARKLADDTQIAAIMKLLHDDAQGDNGQMSLGAYRGLAERVLKAVESSARKLAAPERTEQAAPEGMKPAFPLSAWGTMDYARQALSAMLTHMGMDEDEWNRPTFDQSRSGVKALEYQLTQPDQVALWKTRYLQVKAPLQAFHEKAVAAGFDGIADALDAASPLTASPTAKPSVEPVGEREADLLTQAIQMLNANPYSLTKDECIEEIKRLRAARTTPPPAPVLLSDAWQPIETAPKNGTAFWAFSVDLIDLDFNPQGAVECAWNGDEFIGCVWNGQQDSWYGTPIKPTHWQPLPPPPIEQAIGRASREAK